MTIAAPVAPYLLLLGLGFFFGLAFEEFHAKGGVQPGGVRSFPLLALVGALLYQLDPARLVPLTAGLVGVAGWLGCFYWRHLAEIDPEGQPNVGLMTPICNVLAYLLGPVALTQPPWMAIGSTVTAVLLLTARERLHGFARQLEMAEIVTAGKFLILTGLILPFLPDTPVTPLLPLTPRQVWLAVLAVCTVSYASYLLQRYAAPRDGGLWAAVLGGLYSSTATTVVLARRAKADPAGGREMRTGIILATAIMYLRVLIVVAFFDRRLAFALAPPLLILALGGLLLSAATFWLDGSRTAGPLPASAPANPLELTAALVFAALFVLVSLASAWVRGTFGDGGLYILAAAVGATDIDPFVLSIASGASPVSTGTAAAAVLVAAASNNVLKAAYAAGFAGIRAAAIPAVALSLLAAAGAAAAWWDVG